MTTIESFFARGEKMAKFKKPLSEHEWNRFSKTLKRAQDADLDALAQIFIEKVPQYVESEYGFTVMALPEPIVIGGLMGKKENPGVVFSYPDKPDYASILLGISKIGGVIRIDSIQYGSVSKNMQHSNTASNSGSSLKGFAKAALHKALTDSNEIEEEHMRYKAIDSAILEVVESFTDRS